MTILGLLTLSTLALAVLTVVRRRPVASGVVPDFDGYLDRWSAVHEDYDARPTRVLRGWLALMYRLAAPLARFGVTPHAITLWNVYLAGVAVSLVLIGGGWAIVAAAVIVGSAIGDGLDGAVAVLSDRASRWGYVIDSVADRVTELLFLAAAALAGAPGVLTAVTAAAVFLVEYTRARAQNAGADVGTVITVGERPSRVICCAIAVASAVLPLDVATVFSGASIGVLLILSLVGVGHLLIAAHGRLR